MSCDNGGGGHAPVWLYLDHEELWTYVTGIAHFGEIPIALHS